MIKKIKHITSLYALIFAFLLSFSGCEKIETDNESKESTSTDISKDDIDKNKDDKGGEDNGEGTEGGETADDKDGETGENSDDKGGDSDLTDDTGYQTGDIVSVSEFLKKDITCQVWVVGKIVGDCTRSKKYAEFNAPFTHSQAILLADSPNEKDIDKTIAICLTTNKGMRMALNLADNPTNHNEDVAVFGFRGSYLGICGIKHPDGYKFPVNIK